MALTGKFDFRKTFWGKIVLRVEEEVKPFWSKAGALKRRWRDATLMDLTAPEMRTLMLFHMRQVLTPEQRTKFTPLHDKWVKDHPRRGGDAHDGPPRK